MKPKRSAVVMIAARRIHSKKSHHSCIALDMAAYIAGRRPDLSRRFVKLFSPKAHNTCGEFWLDDAYPIDTNPDELREWRVTALCLFAAMLEAEGK